MKFISVVLIIVFLGLQYQIWFHNGGLKWQYQSMQQKAIQIQEQNKHLRERNDALQAEVDDLKEGSDAISEIVRNQHQYIQAGERFYKIQ